MGLLIRKAKQQDLCSVSALLTATWNDTYSQIYSQSQIDDLTSRWHNIDVLARQSADPGILFLVAEYEIGIVGHALARKHADDVIWLVRLYVLPQVQGSGVGNQLLEHVIKRFSPVKSVKLEIEPQNTRALGFYKSHGFVKIGETENCGGDSEIPALIMQKVLNHG